MPAPTNPQRSRMMASIRGKDTLPELALRHALFSAGFRYRLHVRALPGSPDLVFPKYRAVVFVHGCFWHRHVGCRYTTSPKTNVDFWNLKFEGNISRDARNVALLMERGWRVAIVWECALKRSTQEATQAVSIWLPGTASKLIVD
jgi:DNA mismatch endonuclease (patch repair protein)